MLYQDHKNSSDTEAANPTAHVDPQPSAAKPVSLTTAGPQQPLSTAPTGSTAAATAAAAAAAAAAATVVTTPLSMPGRPVTARLAAAHDEPVLIGRVVSAESSAVRGASARPSSATATTATAVGKTTTTHNENDDDDDANVDAGSDTSSSTAASSNSFVGDTDKTELIFSFGRYVGQVDPLTGLRDGEGCLHYKSGNVYTGHWRDGAADGFGEKRYKNGDIYRGHWDQGKRSGRGAYLFAQGHFYDGMYINDQPEGYGIFTTLQGDRFAGQWKAGKKHGKGRETLVSGQVFIGNWRAGQKQGRGKLYLPGAEGFIYGIWNNDKFFRELTESEMGVDGKEDVVDEFGLPRDASAPPVTAPWMKPAPVGATVTDRVLMGVTALENRMESLGKALERVIVGTNAEGDASALSGAAPHRAATTGAGAAAARASAPQTLFASPDRQTAEGILASDVEEEEEDQEPTAAVELHPPPPPAARAMPSAAVLSTAVEETEEEAAEEGFATTALAAARASAAPTAAEH